MLITNTPAKLHSSVVSRKYTDKVFCFFEGLNGDRGPDEGAGIGVVMLDELDDVGDELFHTPKGSAANGSSGDHVEPDLNLVEPGNVRWSKVNVIPGTNR